MQIISRSRIVLGILLFIGVVLVVFGSRVRVLERYGTDMPWWDQWGSEGEVLITPWLQHGEFWKNLLVPHSEHRIAPTKALNLALTALGGQWDARLEAMVNAFLFAVCAAVLLHWVRRRFDLYWSLTAAVLVTLLLSLPLAVENILGGFQSVFAFLVGLSLFAMYFLISRPAGSPLWLLGFIAGCLSLTNMGSGFFFSIPVVGVIAFRLLKSPRHLGHWVTLIVCIIFAVVGWHTRPAAPWQSGLYAKTVTDFLLGFIRCLAWPKPEWLVPGLLIWLPWGILAFRWLRSSSDREDSSKTFLLAGGVWVLLQFIAVSYTRGAGGGYPSTRYVEILVFGLLCCFLSIPLSLPQQRWKAIRLNLYCLVLHASPRNGWDRMSLVVGAFWILGVASAALYQAGAIYKTSLPATKTVYLKSERNVQGYLMTNDFKFLDNGDIPLFAGEPLARILTSPELRNVMPAGVRAPLLVYSNDESDAFRLSGVKPGTYPLYNRWFWGSYGANASSEKPVWRSEVLPGSSFAYWKIETTGALGQPGTSLQLVSERTGEVLSNLAPTKNAGIRWRAAYAPAPKEPVRIVARVDSPSVWFGFSEPVEMSAASYWAWKITKEGHWFILVGLLLAAKGAVGLIMIQRQNRPASRSNPSSVLVKELHEA